MRGGDPLMPFYRCFKHLQAGGRCVVFHGIVATLLTTSVFRQSPAAELQIQQQNQGTVQILLDGQPVLESPATGLWSIAMDWHDGWPAGWCHGSVQEIERVADWTIVRGQVDTPKGRWEVSDAYRQEAGMVRCTRRFVWLGREVAKRCTLSIQYQSPGKGCGVVMPGVLYHGNPSGAKSGRVPVFTGEVAESAFFEEHRLPMPFVSLEWPDDPTATDPKWRGVALHTCPSPVPFGQRRDQWWSLGCRADRSGTTLAVFSGPCAANGQHSVIKARQAEFTSYDNAFLNVPPNGIVEKTFFLQAFDVAAEGTGFQHATRACLNRFPRLDPHSFPTFEEILRAKSRFAQTRWHETDTAAGFRKFASPDRPFFVFGWCGQAAALGYALQVLGPQLQYPDVDQVVTKALDTLAEATFYEDGFHTWFNYENGQWSRIELLSQGQGMDNIANAIRVGRARGLATQRWEEFLQHACDVHAKRILADDWSPVSTNEAFFIAPLMKASRLFNQPTYLQAALHAADLYGARHTNMREPYWGGTLDASCEDKEGAYAALQGFLAAYEATRNQKYLHWAEHALDVVLTYVCVWDIDMPAGRLRDHDFRTRGWTAVSVQNMHVDVYGVLMVPEIYRMGELLKRDDLKRIALVMYRSCGQLIDPYGSQGEQPQHTNYAQGGDLSDPANFRGGYHETWTVFWITAHFLNAAAKLHEMGVDLALATTKP
jgi:hypothetical protein